MGRLVTLREETRSAVSSRVNWLIWSTMLAILGLVGAAAASVDCHLRVTRATLEVEARTEEKRAERAQARRVDWHARDMMAAVDLVDVR